MAAFRDLDSVPSRREDAALQEWLDSKYAAHVMRDHPKHTMVMLAGMWGIKMDNRFNLACQILYKIVNSVPHHIACSLLVLLTSN